MKRLKTKYFKHNKDLIAYWLKRLLDRTKPKPPVPLTTEQQLEHDMEKARRVG